LLDAFAGDPDLLANCAPTELSKKPPEEAFLGADLVADFLGSSIFLVAN
jgi:hypothetical protein